MEDAYPTRGTLSTFPVFDEVAHLLLFLFYFDYCIFPAVCDFFPVQSVSLEYNFLISLKSSQQKFYGRHHELVDRYGVSICAMKTDVFNVS